MSSLYKKVSLVIVELGVMKKRFNRFVIMTDIVSLEQ